MLVLVVGRAYGRGRGLFVGFCEGPAEDSRAGEDDLRYYAVRLKTILDYVLKMCGVLLGRHTILYSDKRKRSDDSKCTSPSTQKVDEHRRCRRRSRTPGGSFRRMHDSDLPVRRGIHNVAHLRYQVVCSQMCATVRRVDRSGFHTSSSHRRMCGSAMDS